MFWAINFDMDGNQELIEDLDKGENSDSDDRLRPGKDAIEGNHLVETTEKEGGSWLNNVKNTVKKAVDCCKEI